METFASYFQREAFEKLLLLLLPVFFESSFLGLVRPAPGLVPFLAANEVVFVFVFG